MTESLKKVVDALLADPEARNRLEAAIARDLADQGKGFSWQRARPFLAGASSALVVLLAFLVPSLQEQWDLYRTRAAVDRYAEVARGLLDNGHYASAEEAFGRALELAGNQRMDLLEGQIEARVMRVYENPAWRGEVDDNVTEADFLYLLELETGRDKAPDRAATLAAYGAFLAGLNRTTEAERALRESIALDAKAAEPHVHLGNLYDDLDRPKDAEAEYRAAIALDPGEAHARYNLGLLLSATGRPALAEAEFRAALQLEPGDVDSSLALIESLKAQGKPLDARREADAALRRNPASEELRAAQGGLPPAP